MNPITYALDHVKRTIPNEALQKAFPSKKATCDGHFNPNTLADRIRTSVILQRILIDINITSGIRRNLHTSEGTLIYLGEREAVYHFTNEVLEDKEIVAVHTLVEGAFHTDGINGDPSWSSRTACGNGGTGVISDLLQIMMNTTGTNYGKPIHDNLRLEQKNTIVVSDVNRHIEGWFRVILGYDTTLTHIQPRNYIAFARLVTLATKSFMYNKLSLSLGQASIYAGQNFDELSGYISSLSEAEEQYQEELLRWTKIAFMNDRTQYKEYISLQMNPF